MELANESFIRSNDYATGLGGNQDGEGTGRDGGRDGKEAMGKLGKMVISEKFGERDGTNAEFAWDISTTEARIVSQTCDHECCPNCMPYRKCSRAFTSSRLLPSALTSCLPGKGKFYFS